MKILPPFQELPSPSAIASFLSGAEPEKGYAHWRGGFIQAILHKLEPNGLWNGHRFWAPNGSLAYPDCGPNLEWATAEYRACSLEGVLQEKASERILQKALEELILEYRLEDFALYKNNVGPDNITKDIVKEVTYASHHNYSYLTSRRSQVFSLMTNFVPVSLILTGNGHVYSRGGTMYYSLSQRAPHIERLSGDITIKDRSIINTRDEPLMDPISGLSRFHLIACDATRCEYQTWLKDAVTHLVLRIAEEVDDRSVFPPNLCLPLEELQAINLSFQVDFDYKVRLNWMFGDKENFVDYNYRFLHLAKQLSPLSEDEKKALEEWEYVLDLIKAKAFKKLVGKLDWATKWYLLKNQMKAGGYGLEDPRAYVVNMEYHNISNSPEKSWFARLDEKGFIKHLVDEEEIVRAMISGPQTRAKCRSDFINFCLRNPALRSRARNVGWDCATVDGHPGPIIFGEKHDPFSTSSETLQKFFDCYPEKKSQ